MRITLPETADWPFGDRAEMSAEEFNRLVGGQGQTVVVPPAEDAAPDWTTSEKRFQQKVMDYARSHGWELCYHTFDSASSAPGFPDLVLGKGGVIRWVAELKLVGKRPTKDQQAWLDAFAAAGIPADVWTPDDIEAIERILA